MGKLNPKNKTFKSWDDIGDLQFDFMLEKGLKPEHRLLDIGCGTLRGGKRFIPYLSPGNYYGVDKDAGCIADGRKWLMEHYAISTVGSHIFVTSDYLFLPSGSRGLKFDFAIAQSVFTHLSDTHILKCLEGVKKVLAEDGRFFATFFEAKRDEKEIVWDERTITHSGADPGHQSFGKILSLTTKAGLEVRNLGDWNHPRHQKMLEFGHFLPEVEIPSVVCPSAVHDPHKLRDMPANYLGIDIQSILKNVTMLNTSPDVLEGTVTGKEVKPDESPKKKKSSKAVGSNDSSGRGRKHRKVPKVDN